MQNGTKIFGKKIATVIYLTAVLSGIISANVLFAEAESISPDNADAKYTDEITESESSLVLESDKPIISLDCDTTDPQKSHEIVVTARDSEEEGQEPYSYSGIQNIFYTLEKDGEEIYSDIPCYGEERLQFPTKMEEIRDARELAYSISLEEDGEGNKLNGTYELTAWSVDYCGNESEKMSIQLDFDNEPPKLQAEFDQCQNTFDGIDYYNENLTVTFTVTDHYPLPDNSLNLEINSEPVSIEADQSQSTDHEKIYKLRIEDEGAYCFSASGADMSGNESERITTETRILDKTAPVLDSVSYPAGEDERDGTYYYGENEESCHICLTLTEKFFDADKANDCITISFSDPETDRILTDEEYRVEWHEGANNDEHTARITLPDADGTYVLSFAYQDLVMNPLEGGTFTSAVMIVDSTKPVLNSVLYPENSRTGSDGNYYYGQGTDTYEIELSLTEKNFDADAANDFIDVDFTAAGQDTSSKLEKEKYSVVWREGEGSDGHIALITLPDDEGTYQLTFAYQDLAQNPLEDGIFKSAYLIIDKTCPVVTSITSTGMAKGPYDTKAGISDYYYNDSEVKITLTIEDENLPAIWTASAKCSGTDADKKIMDIQSDHVTFTLSEEGKYTGLTVSGTDLAGNPLILQTEDAENSMNAYEHSEWDTAASDLDEDGNGAITLKHGKVLDHTAPTAEITYASEDIPNLYEGEDGRTAAAYYNKDIIAHINITDQYAVDCEKMFAAQNAASGRKILRADITYRIDADGRNYFTVYGTDRAGNALTVKEQIPGKQTLLVTEGCGTAYKANYILVRDTVAPTYTLAVLPDSGVKNKGRQNGRYYFNGSYTAMVSVDETNFDEERIRVRKGSVVSGEYNAASKVVKSFEVRIAYVGNQKYIDQADKTNGVYRYQIYGTDKAGNALVPSDRENLDGSTSVKDQNDEKTADLSCHIVVDTVKPAGVLNIGDYYRVLLETGTVERSEPYRKERSASIQITSEDRSPVLITYTVDSTVNKEKNYRSKSYAYGQTAKSSVNGEQIFRVTSVRLTDRAGNQSILKKTNRIYLDVTAPVIDELAPIISVEAAADTDIHGPEGTPLFNGDVPLHIRVSEPYAGIRSSGLSGVTCHLYINGEEVNEDQRTLNPASAKAWNHNYKDPTLVYEIDETIRVSASEHNYNDILVSVEAEDNAGNRNSKSYAFGIDVTAPVIEVEYDNNEAENEKYFKADRVATITVTERNFSADLIDISTESTGISGWSYVAGSSANGDDDQWIAEVMYNADGEYTLNVFGEDLLGQNADDVTYIGTAPQEFVIDQTAPVLTLEFDRNDPANGKYYNSSRSATLTVDDANFNGVSDIAVNASGGGTVPTFRFSGNTALAVFDMDGVYRFGGTVTDLAGNVSLPVDCEEFIIDQTEPVITFHNVEDMTAYGKSEEAFSPYISIEDTNFDPSGVAVTMTKIRWDSEEELSSFGGLNGNSWYLDELTEIPENDAVYVLSVQVQDMAGNLNAGDDQITFSLNRFGSVYVLGENTKDLLNRYYTREAETLELTEYNLSSQEDSWIDISRNSEEEIRLEPGGDYSVSVSGDSGNDCNWKKTDYQIKNSNFEADGTYRVIVYSRDTLENATTNENPASEEYASVIEFCRDTVAPTLTLTGVEEGGSYNESAMTLLVSYFDNNEMSRLDICVVNAEDENDVISSAQYLVEDGTLEEVSGKIEYLLKEDSRMQKVIVTAMDRAGNPGTPEELAALNQTVTFTMSTNPLIRFYRNTAAFIGTIVSCAAILILLALLILREQCRKEQAEKSCL